MIFYIKVKSSICESNLQFVYELSTMLGYVLTTVDQGVRKLQHFTYTLRLRGVRTPSERHCGSAPEALIL